MGNDEEGKLAGAAVEDFVTSVIAADFEEAGEEDVFRKLRVELEPSVSGRVIRDKMRECLQAALDRAAIAAG